MTEKAEQNDGEGKALQPKRRRNKDDVNDDDDIAAIERRAMTTNRRKMTIYDCWIRGFLLLVTILSIVVLVAVVVVVAILVGNFEVLMIVCSHGRNETSCLVRYMGKEGLSIRRCMLRDGRKRTLRCDEM